ncbi:phosphotyrosine protein phosphatase II [Gloeophyllum trabeum ATCC 11539]|uniref:protein-tyrosine-phosphatase n=1 Tax=Gloeophyllum trabeum (strain ATCC 11539 / FP-39264 / Madison 617) TaxID=670483 RepID=S7RPU9_GLOTA|nr:phosphotyrosine protein phosphatase II [Gloeophyllum trabeum ATCC 11539]EPQ54914.1 phosphotyrosine protein phosphatase II [Gloeophyllum trabeum ATCC 11539]
MINFDGLSPEVMEAMCTPMHLILPPASLPASPTSHTGALYLGSLAASIDKELLRTHRISYLVQVLDAPWLPSPFDGIRCHRIDILDLPGADLKSHLAEACDVIDGAIARGENVLVHCQQGVSRSAAIVIAYLISRHNMSFDAAHELVRKKRPCIKPNAGFVSCLREWEGMWRRRGAVQSSGAHGSGYAQPSSYGSGDAPQRQPMRRTMSSR